MKSFEVETAHWGLVEYRADTVTVDPFGGLVLSLPGRRVGYLRKGQWGAWWEKDARQVTEEAEGPPEGKGESDSPFQVVGRQQYRGTFEPREKPVLP